MSIPGYSASDLSLARACLKERFGFDVDVQEAETEVRLNPGDRELALCPAVYWQVEKCSFVVAKTGPAGYPRDVLLFHQGPFRHVARRSTTTSAIA
jgi:hypothetical protein